MWLAILLVILLIVFLAMPKKEKEQKQTMTAYKATNGDGWEAAKERLDRDYTQTIRQAAAALVASAGTLTPDPLRGFCNYDYFTVKGRKPSTGRMNTRHIAAFSEAEARHLAVTREQLAEPLEVSLEVFHPAPASEYGFTLPSGASYDDNQALEASVFSHDNVAVTLEMYRWMTLRKVKASRLMGINSAVSRLSEVMTDQERVQLYAYIVDCSLARRLPGNMLTEPQRGRYAAIAAKALNQPEVLRSVRENIAKNVPAPSRRTIAYEFVTQNL